MTDLTQVVTTVDNFTQPGGNVISTAPVGDLIDDHNAVVAGLVKLVAAVRTLESIVGLPIADLNTPVKENLVEAINSANRTTNSNDLIGDLTVLTTATQDNLVAAINELEANKVDLSALNTLIPLADSTIAGRVRYATQAEALAGTLTSTAVTPAGAKAVADALKNTILNQTSEIYNTLSALTALVTGSTTITDLINLINLKLDASAISAYGSTLVIAANSAAARNVLGLGTMSTQSTTNGLLDDGTW